MGPRELEGAPEPETSNCLHLEDLEDRKRLKLACADSRTKAACTGRSGGCRGRPCPAAEACNQPEGPQQKVAVGVSLGGLQAADKGQSSARETSIPSIPGKRQHNVAPGGSVFGEAADVPPGEGWLPMSVIRGLGNQKRTARATQISLLSL